MKGSADTLCLPDLCRPAVAVYPAVQVNMNVLNNETWIETIAEIVRQWVKKTEFQGSGTLWSITQRSVDFGKPVLAEFILPHCLPGVGEYLLGKLNESEDNAAMWSSMFFLGQEAWRAFCHVEAGRVWVESEDRVNWRAF